MKTYVALAAASLIANSAVYGGLDEQITVTEVGSQASTVGSAAYFTGTVRVDSLVSRAD